MIRLFVFMGGLTLSFGLFSCSSTSTTRETAAEKQLQHYKPMGSDLRAEY